MIQLVQYTEHSKLNRCTLGDICAVYANISCGTGTGMGSVFKDRSLWKTKKRIKQRSPPYNSWSFLKTLSGQEELCTSVLVHLHILGAGTKMKRMRVCFISMFHLANVLATSNVRPSSSQINRHDSESNTLCWTIALRANSDMLL